MKDNIQPFNYDIYTLYQCHDCEGDGCELCRQMRDEVEGAG